jgi:hypothetical protein
MRGGAGAGVGSIGFPFPGAGLAVSQSTSVPAQGQVLVGNLKVFRTTAARGTLTLEVQGMSRDLPFNRTPLEGNCAGSCFTDDRYIFTSTTDVRLTATFIGDQASTEAIAMVIPAPAGSVPSLWWERHQELDRPA